MRMHARQVGVASRGVAAFGGNASRAPRPQQQQQQQQPPRPPQQPSRPQPHRPPSQPPRQPYAKQGQQQQQQRHHPSPSPFGGLSSTVTTTQRRYQQQQPQRHHVPSYGDVFRNEVDPTKKIRAIFSSVNQVYHPHIFIYVYVCILRNLIVIYMGIMDRVETAISF